MGTRAATTTGSSGEAFLLARLGLPANADPQAVEAAHNGLIDFLASAPADLRTWAAGEIERVDEAYALVSDPTLDRSVVTVAAERLAPRATVSGTAAGTAREVEEWDLEADEPDARRPSRKRAHRTATAPTDVSNDRMTERTLWNRLRRPVLVAGAAVAVLVVVVGVFNLGGGTGLPGVNGNPDIAAPAASPAIDTARVGELMQKISADPRDVTSLQALADIYYLANDFPTAAEFLDRIVGIDATNVTARLALGAAYFNMGKSDQAESQWRAVLAEDADNLEAHYDLGFMYLSRTPADVPAARAEWEKVVAIAPDSDVARTIEQHLASLEAPASPNTSGPAPSPATSVAPTQPGSSPSYAPAAVPAASPATGAN